MRSSKELRPRKEHVMHPMQMHTLARQHIDELHNQAAQARLAREARPSRRWRRRTQPPLADVTPTHYAPSWSSTNDTERHAA
jgi:hypothetical protein